MHFSTSDNREGIIERKAILWLDSGSNLSFKEADSRSSGSSVNSLKLVNDVLLLLSLAETGVLLVRSPLFAAFVQLLLDRTMGNFSLLFSLRIEKTFLRIGFFTQLTSGAVYCEVLETFMRNLI